MQRNKYLDDLGIPINEYGTNFCSNDKRAKYWKQQKKLYGFDSRECWNLDQLFVEWLYSHLRMYVEEANVDLDFHKIIYKGEVYTHKEAINFILDKLSAYLQTNSQKKEEMIKEVQEATRMWAEVVPYMWW